MLMIEKFLDTQKVSELKGLLSRVAYIDGRQTAGNVGARIKSNLQADTWDPNYPAADSYLLKQLGGNEMLKAYARPSVVTPITFARYTQSMTYGDHVDEAIQSMPAGPLRADISFTLFLAGADEYQGGELVLTTRTGEKVVKGNAGDMFVYPTGVLHRVNAVTGGCREVAVGWIQSLVANHEQRELLFDLKQALLVMLQNNGPTPDFLRINRIHANLTRMFSKP